MQVSKCVPHKITTHPTGKTAPHLRFSNILLAVLEVMSTQNSCLMLSLQQIPARLQSTFLQGHRFMQLTGLKPRNTPRVFQPLDPTFSPSTPPKVGGRKSRMQPMLLPYVLLPWLLRGEARSLPQMWGEPPKVPGCRLEKESPLRIFRTNRWDVETSLAKILGPRIFLRNPWSELNQAAACPAILSDFGEAECPSNPRSGREWDVIIGS